MRTRVKMCGMTRYADVQVAVEAGADALGIVFYSNSPRAVSVRQAEEAVKNIPPFVSKIALFVNPDPNEVFDVLDRLPIDAIQFHGDEPPDFCRQFDRPYIKAIRVRPDTDFNSIENAYADASALLLDAYDADQYGGTGQPFNWNLLPDQCKLPIVLAGGLNAANVTQAIEQTRPYAVDVSSGIEASKGIKDPEKIIAFMNEVKRANG